MIGEKRMIRYESDCVGCPTEMGCLGSACPYQNIEVHDCDECGAKDSAKYEMDNTEFCEKCAEEWLQNIFDQYSVTEKAEALDVDIKTIE